MNGGCQAGQRNPEQRKARGGELRGGTPPHYMEDPQKKGAVKFAFCNCMKIKELDDGNQSTYGAHVKRGYTHNRDEKCA